MLKEKQPKVNYISCQSFSKTNVFHFSPFIEACTINDYAYGGADILVGGHFNLKESWEECQKACQEITGCNNWTWFKPDYSGNAKKYCELKYEGGGIPLPGAISGPKNC